MVSGPPIPPSPLSSERLGNFLSTCTFFVVPVCLGRVINN